MRSNINPEEYAAIFDMDGVIIDSNPYHKIAWKAFLDKHGIFADDSTFKNLIFGTSGENAINTLFEEEISMERMLEIAKEIEGNYRKTLVANRGIREIKGLSIFLQKLRKNQIRIALATSAPKENIDLVLDNLKIRDFFEIIINRDDVKHSKPHPEIYLKTMEALQIEKSKCIVFEDSLAGVGSAVNAGITTIGVSSSISPQELLNAGAYEIINNFHEIQVERLFYLLRKNG
jgi:HAD superfamily hydrolase (TIGR01509 family)